MKLFNVGLGLVNRLFTSLKLPLTVIFLTQGSAYAQITADGTLRTTVSQNGNNFTITNGSLAGTNLFHSFQQFSVPTGGSAIFNLVNTPNISTIFSRVTGGSVSNINGSIQTINSNNPVSLFLLNPNGIVFGPNASLNIGGSFIASTGSSIRFADGVQFSATSSSVSPLLTISVPIGLQMGQNPGAITVQNTGATVISNANGTAAINKAPSTSISVATGNNLALVGGNINLNGGVLNAPSGNIELGSASAGIVNLNTATWKFDYSNIQQFGNIQFSSNSLVNASGSPAGSVHLQGGNISITGSSGVLLVNHGNQQSGNIIVDASGLLEMAGETSTGTAQNYFRTENIDTGIGGNVVVSAPQILVLDGGILARNFGAGIGGNIFVNADSIELNGVAPNNPTATSAISTTNFGSGPGGNIQVSTGELMIENGGGIINTSRSKGTTGNSTVNASDSIELIGENPTNLTSSKIGVQVFNQGNGGLLNVTTPILTVLNGASVNSSVAASGSAGSLVINVSDSIEVSGVGATSGLPSQIVADAEIYPTSFQKLLGLPPFPTGTTGELFINTSNLTITNNGSIGVDHQGIGNAGDLQINANTIYLDNAGSITAATKSGEGGNINIKANTLIMRDGSNITATAGGAGNGGNIIINSPIILGLGNSDIVANAVQGEGGNIYIQTEGLFGLEYRPQLTPGNDITASSQFGLSGSVEVNIIGVNPNSNLVQLPDNFTDHSEQISTGCSERNSSSFVATGRGGIPENPNQPLNSDGSASLGQLTWSDIRDISTYRQTERVTQIPTSPEILVQATGWQRNNLGQIELISSGLPNIPRFLDCAVVSKQ